MQRRDLLKLGPTTGLSLALGAAAFHSVRAQTTTAWPNATNIAVQ